MFVIMPFRANEAIDSGTQEALNYLVGREIPREQKGKSREALYSLINQCGPVVKSYPCWHPLVAGREGIQPQTHPSQAQYHGLDHTVLFRDGFLTCPYGGVEFIQKAVNELNSKDRRYFIEVEELDCMLYHPEATPILVKCSWDKPLLIDGTIPKSLAYPLLLESELPVWRHAQVAETWQTMQRYLLGSPHGKVSSLFVNQDTGNALKKLWNTLIESGMFGPIYVG